MEPEKEFIPLLPLVQEMIQVLQHTLDWPQKCSSVVDIPEKMACWADPQQIHKVLLNLLHNSCIALRNMEGEIHISAREIEDDTGAEKTVITIADTGRGIPALIINKIYEPFFTTRENGTGLGLSIVKQIVKAHQGRITITSMKNQGTTTEVWLPLP
jgi:two-component system sensor histidine kinase PilS (NtrC family)